MVRERAVLFGVEDLEEGACRVPRVRVGELVDLVEDEDGVLRPGPLHALDDPPGKRPDVGPPVPPDLRLVLDPAEADPDVLPAEGVGDALSEARLPGAGRACKEEDRALFLLFEFHDRQVLDDPLLDFLKTVVVAVEHAPGLLNIDRLLLLDRPGQVEQEVKVIPDPLALVVLAAARFKFLQFDERFLPHLFGHRRALDPLPVSVVAGSAVVSVEFFLDNPELLPEHRFPIRPVDLLGRLSGHIDPDLDAFLHPGQEVEELRVASPDRGRFEEFLLIGKVHREERHDEPHDLVDGVHLLDGPGELFGALEVVADLAENRTAVREESGLCLLVEVRYIQNRLADGGEEPVRRREANGLYPHDGLSKDQVAVIRRLHVRYLKQAPRRVERLGRDRFWVRAAPDGEPDRVYGFGSVRRGEQRLSGGRVDLELCPALWIDHGLKERYDHGLSGSDIW